MATEQAPQRIARLTPLSEVLARIDALVKPVMPRRIEIAEAVGHVLAEDAVASLALPAAARALRDGYAVCADVVGDAGSYAPAALTAPPRIDVGETMPPGTDAVLPADALVERGGRFDAIASVAPGEGILAAAADVRAGEPLRRAGERLRHVDVALLSACRLSPLAVRTPQVRIVNARGDRDTIIDAICSLIAGAVADDGGVARCEGGDLAGVLSDADCDGIIAIGGTSSGRHDESVHMLARAGHVEVHGVALLPGETAAFGVVASRPVLLIPGRIDAALAVWLTIGLPMLARLSRQTEQAPAMMMTLARKVASPLGLTEVVPVRCRDGNARPIASGYWPVSAMADADGWIMVQADSEGFPAGAQVVVRRWP